MTTQARPGGGAYPRHSSSEHWAIGPKADDFAGERRYGPGWFKFSGMNQILIFRLHITFRRLSAMPYSITGKTSPPTNTSQIFFQETATEVGEALAEGMEDTMEADTEEVMEEEEVGITTAGA